LGTGVLDWSTGIYNPLVKQKRMNKTALVPCIVRMDGLAEEDSPSEKIHLPAP